MRVYWYCVIVVVVIGEYLGKDRKIEFKDCLEFYWESFRKVYEVISQKKLLRFKSKCILGWQLFSFDFYVV